MIVVVYTKSREIPIMKLKSQYFKPQKRVLRGFLIILNFHSSSEIRCFVIEFFRSESFFTIKKFISIVMVIGLPITCAVVETASSCLQANLDQIIISYFHVYTSRSAEKFTEKSS